MGIHKLISMTDFVISQWDKDITSEEFSQSMINYATFLKQPLKLEMFVPCDEEGNVLSEPKDWKVYESGGSVFMNIDEILPCQEYKKAKQNVLFGFKPQFDIGVIKHHISQGRNVEYLSNFGSIELTPTAIKQIVL